MKRSFGTLRLRAAIAAAALGCGIGVADAGTCVGDLNGDNIVDLGDLGVLLANYGLSGATPEQGDLDGNTIIDLSDLGLMLTAFGQPCAAPPTLLELAGNPLADYPHFEFVQAFNTGEEVSVGIDPSRAGGALGGALYVVANKTAAEWDADPALLDVRAGGPQVVVITGSTIQENTFTVAAAGELNADAGTDLGVGYDVVLDADADGLLGVGDLIDGRGDEAGLNVFRDLTTLGPLATTSVTYTGGRFLDQKTWYPTDIANLGPRPLVVISHGNGHEYTWYDYLQQHLASYGYVVMSHENNTQPGIESASQTTLRNTDYFLANLGTIGGGVFNGLIDAERIVWIGHSRGGEGVARAYDKLLDGEFVPTDFTIDQIRLISSIAPTDFLLTNASNPHDAFYHLIAGSADGDVNGGVSSDIVQYMHIYGRATDYRQATQVQGADHNDFNCCGFQDFVGPPGTELGRTTVQTITKAVYLALVEHYVDDNAPVREYLWRQYEGFRSDSAPSTATVSHQYVAGAGAGHYVIDDFQTETSTLVSSSGGAVTSTVTNLVEGLLDDGNTNYSWLASDPMNGMTHAMSTDISRGAVFDWAAGTNAFIEWEILLGERDFTDDSFLSFRGCQGTRHPNTTAVLGDLDFSVTLRDGAGNTSSISISAYGGGLEEPYQRGDFGAGPGWLNEFETVRVRLTDFVANGRTLDLGDVVAVRFDFGDGFGSSQGRIGIDDVEIIPAVETLPIHVERAGGGATPTAAIEARDAAIHTPEAPVAVSDVVYARRFTLAHPEAFAWRADKPQYRGGWVLVVRTESELLHPTQLAQRQLLVGEQIAERVNVGFGSGHLVVVVPGGVELASAIVRFGSAELPERIDAEWLAGELQAAAGLASVGAEAAARAETLGGDVISVSSREALDELLANLVETYAPDESDRIAALRLRSGE